MRAGVARGTRPLESRPHLPPARRRMPAIRTAVNARSEEFRANAGRLERQDLVLLTTTGAKSGPTP